MLLPFVTRRTPVYWALSACFLVASALTAQQRPAPRRPSDRVVFQFEAGGQRRVEQKSATGGFGWLTIGYQSRYFAGFVAAGVEDAEWFAPDSITLQSLPSLTTFLRSGGKWWGAFSVEFGPVLGNLPPEEASWYFSAAPGAGGPMPAEGEPGLWGVAIRSEVRVWFDVPDTSSSGQADARSIRDYGVYAHLYYLTSGLAVRFLLGAVENGRLDRNFELTGFQSLRPQVRATALVPLLRNARGRPTLMAFGQIQIEEPLLMKSASYTLADGQAAGRDRLGELAVRIGGSVPVATLLAGR